MRATFFINKFSSMMKSQFRGIQRYSGEYNILLFTVGIIYLDHFLEKKIRRDLEKLIQVKRQMERLQEEFKVGI
eukprot:403369945